MRIGIVTLPFHTNYGGVLQAWALQTVLTRMGHKVCFIKEKEDDIIPVKYYIYDLLGAILNKIGKNMPITKRINELYGSYHFRHFIHKHFARIYSLKEFDKNISDYEVIVVGSDQVWRPWSKKHSLFYFLDFAKNLNIYRIAYAVSFGLNHLGYTEDERKDVVDLVKLFTRVSVREDDAVAICKNDLHVDAIQVLDPTLLLSKSDYTSIIGRKTYDVSKLVSFILDPDNDKNSIVSYLEGSFGKSIQANESKIPLLPIEDWLYRMMGAECIVTDSFHGTAFSINFNKPFVVLANPNRGNSRLLSILRLFKLENRLVTTEEEAKRILKEPIDWECVNKILDSERIKAFDFLNID